ncbi:hypothetical protein [Pantoea ananatis]|uniref:hypothetical protein n=1 Tax=Pantoea ananas TaxID=553 RepID=UPI000D5D6A3C|nr:hypothetical protein [Pantoea ananatis]PVY84001.1 hypothetical protein C7427_105215 [Pantoea ananatis]
MKKTKLVTVLLAFGVASSTAMASTQSHNVLQSVPTSAVTATWYSLSHDLNTVSGDVKLSDLKSEKMNSSAAEGHKLASFANGCNDANYRWYEYSGIEALTCYFSGQWG